MTDSIDDGISRSRAPSTLSYLFEDVESIPDAVLEKVGIVKKQLENVPLLVS